ncbi:MAG: hypothetical protein IPJ07_14440, partial [Acidobacteria bacterium]|nr:hypothetical protein [Acidobacteriota bacterium]
MLAQQALDRRDKEDRTSVGQLLWEKVTLGLALVRMEKGDEAIEHLDFANSRGMGWCYNIVPMFAMAGLIEYQYHEAMKISRKLERQEKLSRTDFIYKQYCKSDPVNQFQIPAAEAHLAMARVHLARREHEDANNLALMAFKIADGQ